MLGALLLSACSPEGGSAASTSQSTSETTSAKTAAGASNPLAGAVFYTDPAGHAQTQLAQWQASGEQEKAFWLRRLAEQPVATWFTGGEGDVSADVRRLTSGAAAAGQVPVLVAYNVPGRDCGSYSRGGAGDAGQYAAWIERFAQGIGTAKAVVVLEPDAVIHALDGCAAAAGLDQAERFAMLRAAVDRLKQNPATVVYLDAGNAGWIADEGVVAQALRASGVQEADGFSLNVSNFKSTPDSTTYGRGISALLGGARFVVDTSRNGSGPAAPDGQGTEWCNPTHRSLGNLPTSATGEDLIDAYLWIKVPGDSDGACRPGEPPAGTWWPEYALNLVMQTQMGHPYQGH